MTSELRSDMAFDLESQDEELAPRIKRLQRLRSAWSFLAPAAASAGARNEIGETGRALTDHLRTIVASRSDITSGALIGIDALLAEFETSIQQVATSLPVSQLRSALPVCRESNRRGLLDLLDVLLTEGSSPPGRIEERIGVIDCLITLACTGGATSGSIQFDPVTLTDRLNSLCEATDDPQDLTLAEVEAEFFAAANLDSEDLRAEIQQRTLRKIKSSLGRSYFTPRVLRSIVTYNAAVVALVSDKLLDSFDWGGVDETPSTPIGSVFECDAMKDLADGVRRRARGEEAAANPIDRIAWTLDFEYLADNERKALCEDTLGTKDDPLGTAILLGLLSRSLAVLSVELQDVGLAPDALSDVWVPEVSKLFQDEINRYIADDAYKVACALSELKNKFLLSPLADQRRESPAPVAAAPALESQPKEKAASARSLILDALEMNRKDGDERAARVSLQNVPWFAIARGTGTLLLLALVAFALLSNRNVDLDRLSPQQLDVLSPYLEDGRRSGNGQGLAFVGKIDPEWQRLPIEEREQIAIELVERLRDRGIRQVMIYDEHDQIRIQALGSQATHVL